MSSRSLPAMNSLLRNVHFLAITLLFVLLILFYNSSYLGIDLIFPFLQEISNARGIYALILSFTFLLPLLYSSTFFALKGALISWIVFVSAILPRLLNEPPTAENIVGAALFITVALLLNLLVAYITSSISHDKQYLLKPRISRLTSLARLLKVHQFEQQYIARKLHDNIIQSLLVVVNRVHHMETSDYGKSTPEIKKQTEKIQTLLLHTIDDIRRISYGFRPSVIDNVGLLPILKWQAERITQENHIKVDVIVNGLEHKLTPESEATLYRIIQEALNNVCKHSKSSNAAVTVDFAANDFTVTMEDNGVGFSVPASMKNFSKDGKLGLERMQHQASLLNGIITIDSSPGKGTRIVFRTDTLL
jgi:signal transduction histidine kinase